MNTNIRAKFIRLVLASTVGSLLWAGCTTTNEVVIQEPAGAEMAVAVRDASPPIVAGVPVDREDVAAAPVDLTNRRPDTHPELRSGLWQSASQGAVNTVPVIEAPTVELPEIPPGTADSGYLLSYNPEVVNIAIDDAAAEGIIVEAAGAERPRRLWAPKKTLKVEPPPAPPVVEPAPVIEIQPAPQSSSPQPAPAPAPLKNEGENGNRALQRVFFVNQ